MNEHDSLPDRAPDFVKYSKCEYGNQNFYFEEMMMFSHTYVIPYPLRYNEVSECLDFFDHTGNMFWINLCKDVTKAYQEHIFEKEFVKIIWPYWE